MSCVLKNLLTQPSRVTSTSSSTSGASSVDDAVASSLMLSSASDWLDILTRLSRKQLHLTLSEQLHLLHNFSQRFLARPSELQQLFGKSSTTPRTDITTTNNDSLGRLFINLVSRVLCPHVDAEGGFRLPVLLLASTTVAGGSEAGHLHSAMDIADSGLDSGTGADGSAGAGASGSAVNDEQYALETGWKQTTFRLFALKEYLISQQQQQQQVSAVGCASSLQSLAGVLMSRVVLAPLLGAAIPLSSSASVSVSISGSSDPSTVGGIVPMDIADEAASSGSANVSARPSSADMVVSTSVINTYTQLLLACPTEAPIDPANSGANEPPDSNSNSNSTSASSSYGRHAASSKNNFSAESRVSLLMDLAFSHSGHSSEPLAKRLWAFLWSAYGETYLDSVITMPDAQVLLHFKTVQKSLVDFNGAGGNVFAFGQSNSSTENNSELELQRGAVRLYGDVLSALYLFCTVLYQQLGAVDDEELLEQGKIFTLEEVRAIVRFLRQWLTKLYWLEPLYSANDRYEHITKGDATETHFLKLNCQVAATKLFNHLCRRNERRKFLEELSDWQWGPLASSDLLIVDPGADSSNAGDFGSLVLKNAKVKCVLSCIPQVMQKCFVFCIRFGSVFFTVVLFVLTANTIFGEIVCRWCPFRSALVCCTLS
jgi:hypothetical protein